MVKQNQNKSRFGAPQISNNDVEHIKKEDEKENYIEVLKNRKLALSLVKTVTMMKTLEQGSKTIPVKDKKQIVS